jgi:hypothetical protein
MRRLKELKEGNKTMLASSSMSFFPPIKGALRESSSAMSRSLKPLVIPMTATVNQNQTPDLSLFNKPPRPTTRRVVKLQPLVPESHHGSAKETGIASNHFTENSGSDFATIAMPSNADWELIDFDEGEIIRVSNHTLR